MKYAFLAMLLILAACGSGTQTITSQHVTMIRPNMSGYQCDVVDQFPDPQALTDLQVAKLLVDLHTNNVRCYNALEGLKKLFDDVEKVIPSP